VIVQRAAAGRPFFMCASALERRVLRAFVRRALGLAGAALLAGCAGLPAPRQAGEAEDWQDVVLPGKSRTVYRWERQEEGRRELVAHADASASIFRRRLHRSAAALRDVEFGWWVQALPVGADISEPDKTDSAARVMFAFDGDADRLSPRNQLMFDLARTLTGEAPPFATLVYVWDATAPVGSVIVHPRNDRVRKIVVESGSGALRQWRRYRRSLVDDYRLAFGESPGPLLAVAVMTDGDNTRSRLTTRYSDIEFR
jgi:hypothetical protein